MPNLLANHNKAIINVGPTITPSGSSYTTTTNGSYTIYTFKSNGTLTLSNCESKTLNICCIAGGGAGGNGGGSCGELLYQNNITGISNDTITIVVGAGGTALNMNSGPVNPSNGSNSSITFSTNTSYNKTSLGGGGGQPYPNGTNAAGIGGGTGSDVQFSGFNSNKTAGQPLNSNNIPTGFSSNPECKGGFGCLINSVDSGGGGCGFSSGGFGLGTAVVRNNVLPAYSTPNGTRTGHGLTIPTDSRRAHGGFGVQLSTLLTGYTSGIWYCGGGGACDGYNDVGYDLVGWSNSGSGWGIKRRTASVVQNFANMSSLNGVATNQNAVANSGSGGGGALSGSGNSGAGGSGVVIIVVS